MVARRPKVRAAPNRTTSKTSLLKSLVIFASLSRPQNLRLFRWFLYRTSRREGDGRRLSAPQIVQYPLAMTAETALDRIDRRILTVLQADGRITNQDLAGQVALSPSACLARVRRLERAGVIEGYQARLNPWALGPRLILFAEIWLKRHHLEDLARFEAVIAEIPEIVEASQVSGAFDYLLKVVVPNMHLWTRWPKTSSSATSVSRRSPPTFS